MKSLMTYDNWLELEHKLASLSVGYKVTYDNHLGVPEMIITIDTIGVYRTDASFKKD